MNTNNNNNNEKNVAIKIFCIVHNMFILINLELKCNHSFYVLIISLLIYKFKVVIHFIKYI